MKPKKNLVVVLGPTACGKTRLGVTLARKLAGEIISADSRQVYRGLDIGTGKDLEEYGTDEERVGSHLIDIVEPHQEYNLFRFQQDFYAVFKKLQQQSILPLLVGGTGLYLEAVIQGYQLIAAPENEGLRSELAGLSSEELKERLGQIKNLHNTSDFGSRERLIRAIEIASIQASENKSPSICPLILGTRFARSDLYQRIDTRLAQRIEGGLIAEVEGLLARGVGWERLDQLGLEYRFVADYLKGEIPDLLLLQEKLRFAIHHFARRQLSWYRRMERRGTVIHWVDEAEPQTALNIIQEHGIDTGGS
jgi:tRNA dimethylallyltransferase